MSDANSAKKPGVTPAKLVLIGVLALILCGVIYRNYFREPVSSGAPARAQDDRAASAGEADLEKGTSGTKSAAELDELALHAAQLRKKPWPAYSVAQVVAYDPFALPAEFPQPPAPAEVGRRVTRSPAEDEANAERLRAEAAQARAEAIAAIRAKGVQVVLKRGNEFFALIDGHEIRVGDEVEGLEVVEIDATGIYIDKEKGTVQ
jgi:hypothetical protein